MPRAKGGTHPKSGHWLLLEACPSFREKWEEHRASYKCETLLYLDLGELARHLVALYHTGQIQEFPAVFALVERLHPQGDEYVREAATIGLLEGIQNTAQHNGLDPEGFVSCLEPDSAKWWQQLNEFWTGEIPYAGATIDKASREASGDLEGELDTALMRQRHGANKRTD
jgi:hypothetical protein